MFCQELVEKKIHSSADNVLIELDIIDHLRLVNSEKEGEISVYAEALTEPPNFFLEDKGKTILIKDVRPIQIEESSEWDKVCSVEPNFTSYQVHVPKNKTVYISIIEGNFYADAFKGKLNVKIEDGIVKLSEPQDHMNIKLNTGSVVVKNIDTGLINAETNMGILKTNFHKNDSNGHQKMLRDTLGSSGHSIHVRTIMANIYLYERKG